MLRLSGGRLLAYDEHGPEDGAPLLFFHGSPGCRLMWNLFAEQDLAWRLGIRAIVPDRPGMGRSTALPGRSIADWPEDVAALADSLGLARFTVLGYSGGGPYAAACALQMPERLTRVGIVSGTADYEDPRMTAGIDQMTLRLLMMARREPRLFRGALRLMAFGARHAPWLGAKVAQFAVAAPDRALLEQPAFRRHFMAMVREAVTRGTRGTQQDLCMMVSPWGFDPQQIRVPVELWHGEADENAPFAMGKALAAAIPDSRLTPVAGEGHLSVMTKYAEPILKALT